MNTYIYNGPVLYFGRCVVNTWTAKTQATSMKKAINNFKYQYKKSTNLLASASGIELPGKVYCEDVSL